MPEKRYGFWQFCNDNIGPVTFIAFFAVVFGAMTIMAVADYLTR